MPQIPYNPVPSVRNTSVGGQQYNLNVNADMFGANVGRAWQSVAQGLGSIGDVFAAEAFRMQDFKQTADLTDLRTWADRSIQDGVNNITGDGTGFTKQFYEGFQQQAQALKLKYPNARNLDLQVKELERQYFGKVHAVGLKQMNDYYKIQLDEKSTQELDEIQRNPTEINVKQRLAALETLIDKSGMGDAQKEAYKQYIKGAGAKAYAYGVATTDPNRVLGALGQGTSLEQKIAIHESGDKDIGQHPGSSAWGRFGITAGTWQRIANSPQGKAAGLNPDPEARKDPTNNRLGFRVLTQLNAQELDAAGFDTSEKNLYLAHFMGPAGAVKMLKAVQSNPNADAADMFPDAARANPKIFYKTRGRGGENEARTVAEVYELQTRKYAGDKIAMPGSDPILDSLGVDDKTKIAGFAQRTLSSQIQAENAKQAADYAELINTAGLKIRSGEWGMAEVNQLVNNGTVTDMKDVQKLEGWVRSYQDQSDTLSAAMAKLGSPTATWNPFLQEDKKMANALADQTDKLFPEGEQRNRSYVQIAERTGIVPDQLVAQFKQGMNSGNAQDIIRSSMLAEMLQRGNPSIFNGVDESVKQFVADMNGLTVLYGSQEAAAARYAERHQKTAKGEYRFDNAVLEEKEKKIRSNVTEWGKEILISTGLLNRILPGDDAPTGVKNEVARDYMNEFAYKVKAGASEAEADNYAKERIKQAYGSFNGKLMKYPPQKANYPADPDGKFDYLAEDIKATAARNVGGQVVSFSLYPTEATFADAKAGRPAVYNVDVSYLLPNGLEMHGTLRNWRLTPEQIGKHIEAVRTRRLGNEAGIVTPEQIREEMGPLKVPPSNEAVAAAARKRSETMQADQAEALARAKTKQEGTAKAIERLRSLNPSKKVQ